MFAGAWEPTEFKRLSPVGSRLSHLNVFGRTGIAWGQVSWDLTRDGAWICKLGPRLRESDVASQKFPKQHSQQGPTHWMWPISPSQELVSTCSDGPTAIVATTISRQYDVHASHGTTPQ